MLRLNLLQRNVFFSFILIIPLIVMYMCVCVSPSIYLKSIFFLCTIPNYILYSLYMRFEIPIFQTCQHWVFLQMNFLHIQFFSLGRILLYSAMIDMNNPADMRSKYQVLYTYSIHKNDVWQTSRRLGIREVEHFDDTKKIGHFIYSIFCVWEFNKLDFS